MKRQCRTKEQAVEFALNRSKSVKNSGCILWPKPDEQGYCRLFVDGKKGVRMHRIVYELEKGAIPEGLVIDHLCRNRACINVEHLEAVSPATNALRGFGAPALNARKIKCNKGHIYEEVGLVKADKGGRRCVACAKIARKKYKSKPSSKEKNNIAQRIRRAKEKEMSGCKNDTVL